MTKITFVGLGNMGGPMVANLVEAGHAVTGFGLSPASLEAASRNDITTAGGLPEARAGAECVITMLPRASMSFPSGRISRPSFQPERC